MLMCVIPDSVYYDKKYSSILSLFCNFVMLDKFCAYSEWFQIADVKTNWQVRGNRGPIFEDGPNFDLAFQLFHGKNGVIPLTRKSPTTKLDKEPEATANAKFHPLAASAAAISLSSLGGSGPFSFDAFMAKRNLNLNKDDTLKKKKEQQQEKKPSSVVSLFYYIM